MRLRDALASLPDIDHEIIDWLAAINSYKGVCTLTSCAGHTDKEGKGEPFVIMALLNGSSFYRFCKALSPVGHKSSPMLILWPEVKMIMVSAPMADVRASVENEESTFKVPPDRLPSIRNALFKRVIATLEKVMVKASEKEIELKIKLIVGH